ncbi:MAG: stage III sporulation protein AB [Lawsonibacter sp.]|jgi:stage III sporulation protein AB|nr:stage III sporulation protein AB [Lawsonibacter sp.]
MVRLMGAALVAAGGAALGFQAAVGLRKQVRALEEMSQGLALLERELELNAQPLSRLLERGAERSRGPAEELFRDCLQGLNHLDREDFSSLWRRLVSGCHALGSEGQAVLFPLGDTLGRYDGERQREALAAARRRLEELSARLEEDSRRRGRVYQALGLSGGAFLVILLL